MKGSVLPENQTNLGSARMPCSKIRSLALELQDRFSLVEKMIDIVHFHFCSPGGVDSYSL